MLAEEVVLTSSGKGRVAVGGSDHSELVWVDAELLLELQADLQGTAGILILEHVLLLHSAQIQVALIPGFVVRELVVR